MKQKKGAVKHVPAQKTGKRPDKKNTLPPRESASRRLSAPRAAALTCGGAFLLAALCWAAVAAVQQLVPFGENRRIFSDMYLEYWPYLTELHDKLHAGGSVFYSWATGLGGSFLGSLCYYLLSPFNLIVLLLPRAAIPTAIPLLVSLRQCLAAGTMAAYLSLRKNGRPGFAAAGCGVLYAFCGWFVSYSFNIIWLDVFLLIPLLALGVERIILKGRVRLYAVVFTVMLFSNFYFSWFAAVFAVIYFLSFYFSHFRLFSPMAGDAQKTGFFKSRFWHAGLRFAFSSVLSVAVLGAIFVPLVLLAVSGTPENTFTKSYATLFRDMPQQISSLLSGSKTYGTVLNHTEIISVYSGVLPLAALPLLPFLKTVGKKEKWITFGVLLFFVLSFNLPFLDYFWNAFRTVTGLPFRESLLFSFFLIGAAHRVVTSAEAVPKRAWIAAACAGAAVTGLSVTNLLLHKDSALANAEIISLNAFAFAAIAILLAVLPHAKRRLSVALSAVLAVICCLDAFNHQARNPQSMPGDMFQALDSLYRDAASLPEEYGSNDVFYRAHLNNARIGYGNYGAQTGLRGLYQSASVTETNYGFCRKLGFDTNESNYVSSRLQTPAFNSLFSVKYTVESDAFLRQNETQPTRGSCVAERWLKIADNGSVRLYRYDLALPLGFAADPAAADWTLEDHAAFENQNAFYRLAAGANDVMIAAETAPGAAPAEAELRQTGADTYAFSVSPDAAGTVRIPFTVTPEKSGPLYLYVDMHVEKFIAWGISYRQSDGAVISNTQENNTLITLLGSMAAGQPCEIFFLANPGGAGEFTLQAATSDPAALESAYRTLEQKGFWQLDEATDARLSGTVRVSEPGQIFCTSVPYSKNWRVTVDGKTLPQEKLLAVGGGLLGFYIGEGEHAVSMEYRQAGLGAGIAVSCVSLAAAAAWLLLPGLLKKKRKRKEAEAEQ